MSNVRLFQYPNFEELIREVFYNGLLNNVLDAGEVTDKNITQRILMGIITLLQQILQRSKGSEGIVILPGTIITLDRCPEKYKMLFHVLLELKKQDREFSELASVAQQIMQLPSFKEINPKRVLLEMLGYVEPEIYLEPEIKKVAYGEKDITPELIRDTFYNEMVMQGVLAVQNNWFTSDDLSDQEARIYFILPALTILEAIIQSKSCHGIRLLDNEVLTKDNCPKEESFLKLTDRMLSIKGEILSLTQDQLYVVKHLIGSESDLPEHVKNLKTEDLMCFVAEINSIAIDISRREMFHKMIKSVISTCIGSLCSERISEKRI